MQARCYGAAGTVTGSMHLVEADGGRLLLDCRLFQGRRAEAAAINSRFPFAASSIDAVVLSHAHLNHWGNLPTLVRGGFAGPIYCTPATRDLAGLILRDSAKVQHQDAVFANSLPERRGLPSIAPLYTLDDADAAVARIVGVPYHQAFPVAGTTVTFYDAGHILGSAAAPAPPRRVTERPGGSRRTPRSPEVNTRCA